MEGRDRAGRQSSAPLLVSHGLVLMTTWLHLERKTVWGLPGSHRERRWRLYVGRSWLERAMDVAPHVSDMPVAASSPSRMRASSRSLGSTFIYSIHIDGHRVPAFKESSTVAPRRARDVCPSARSPKAPATRPGSALFKGRPLARDGASKITGW